MDERAAGVLGSGIARIVGRSLPAIRKERPRQGSSFVGGPEPLPCTAWKPGRRKGGRILSLEECNAFK